MKKSACPPIKIEQRYTPALLEDKTQNCCTHTLLEDKTQDHCTHTLLEEKTLDHCTHTLFEIKHGTIAKKLTPQIKTTLQLYI